MRQRERSPAQAASAVDVSEEKGTGVVALLIGAVMFALGLFFGWLLHRERVERALYEDVVRTRDRATATLAETSARLELANKDMVRLRGRLTDAQHLLDEREATIGQLRDEASGRDAADAVEVAEPGAHEPIDAAADAATTPSDVQAFDDEDDIDEDDIDEDDITEEVPVQAPAAVAQEPVAQKPAAAPSAVDTTEPEPVAEVPVIPPLVDEPPAAGEPAAAAHGEIGEPLVLEDEGEPQEAGPREDEPTAEAGPRPVTDTAPRSSAPDSDDVSDDLRRISGVGPALEQALRAEGITSYRQLALLDDAAIEGLRAREPRLVNRLRRDDWVGQARALHIDAHGGPP